MIRHSTDGTMVDPAECAAYPADVDDVVDGFCRYCWARVCWECGSHAVWEYTDLDIHRLACSDCLHPWGA